MDSQSAKANYAARLDDDPSAYLRRLNRVVLGCRGCRLSSAVLPGETTISSVYLRRFDRISLGRRRPCLGLDRLSVGWEYLNKDVLVYLGLYLALEVAFMPGSPDRRHRYFHSDV